MCDAKVMEHVAPGFHNLSVPEVQAITSFTLLWTLFEAQALGTAASAARISEQVSLWERQGSIHASWVDPAFVYFQTRYVEGGATNHRFNALNLRAPDQPERIRAAFLSEGAALPERLTASLIVVYRYRNNLFHGLKWAYEMRGQQENFEQSSRLLSKCLEINRVNVT